MVACDGNCASLRPSEVALVLLCTYLDGAVNRLDTNTDIPISTTAISSSSTINTSITSRHQMLRLLDFAIELQKICKVIYIFIIHYLIIIFYIFIFFEYNE